MFEDNPYNGIQELPFQGWFLEGTEDNKNVRFPGLRSTIGR